VRTTDAGKAAPWVVLTGPSGVPLLTQLFPVIGETLADNSHQLSVDLSIAEGKTLGFDTTGWSAKKGKNVGFCIVRDSPKGWKLAGDGLGAADEQVVAGRPWETTARGELKKLAVREATRDEIAAGRV
jgi:hypothetical protein